MTFGTPKVDAEAQKSSFFRTFSENGYVLGTANGNCEGMPCSSMRGETSKYHPFDHELVSLFCDMNYHVPSFSFRNEKGYSSTSRRCLYGQEVHKHELDYARQFWRAYEEDRKLFLLRLQEAHEPSGEVIKYVDADLVAFLEEFEQGGHLRDTVIMLVSDHGMHEIGLQHRLAADDNVEKENFLPLFITLLPNDVGSEVLENARVNQQRFISGYNFYGTMRSLAEGREWANEGRRVVKEGVNADSLLFERLPSSGTCAKENGVFKQCFCR